MQNHHSISLVLYRHDAKRNMARFYALALEPTLFGNIALIRRWGRIGTHGRQKIELFAEPKSAEVALARLRYSKLQRGYEL